MKYTVRRLKPYIHMQGIATYLCVKSPKSRFDSRKTLYAPRIGNNKLFWLTSSYALSILLFILVFWFCQQENEYNEFGSRISYGVQIRFLHYHRWVRLALFWLDPQLWLQCRLGRDKRVNGLQTFRLERK